MLLQPSPCARLGAGFVVALLALVAPAMPAEAQAAPSVTVSPSTVSPGGTTTVTATFSGATFPDQTQFVSMLLSAPGTVAGSVALSAPIVSGALIGCDIPSSDRVDCLWNNTAVDQTATLTLTATASSDASGTFELRTTETHADPGQPIVESPVAGPAALFVNGPFISPPALTVSPSAITPDSSATATASFTVEVTPTALPLRVGIGLLGTGGAGTLVGGPATNLTNCVLDVSQRRYDCDLVDSSVGATASLTVTVLAASSAVPGSTWAVDASQVSPRDGSGAAFSDASLQIIAPSTTSSTPAEPTTSAPGVTPSSVTTVPVTLPATGGDRSPGITLAALGALVAGASLLLATRRRTS
jgi:LPXTG-motif cell wall-anchored protein